MYKNFSMRRLSHFRNDFITHWATMFLDWANTEIIQRWKNFRACSASDQILAVFSWTFGRKLSQRGENFIAVWVNAKKFHRLPSHRGNNFIADWVNAETIFIAFWVNGEIFHKLTAQSQSFYFIEPASLSSELGIYELITRPSSHSQPVAIISELLNRIRADSLS